MTEQQLRDVLARVVPEPPDSVADAGPVVRAARRQRQVLVAGATALAAVLVAGTVIGVQAIAGDEKQDLVADSSIPDPYITAPCPDPSSTWPEGPVSDVAQVTAVRYCARPPVLDGFPATQGPADALVTELSEFASGVRDLPDADPARCAAVDPIPTDDRLLLQLADGSSVVVATGICDDVQVEGHTVSADGIGALYLRWLRAQRDENPYAPDEVTPPTDCMTSGVSPATPASEHLVAAISCTGSGVLRAVTLAADETARLQEAWRTASEDTANCDDPGLAPMTILARTDRGDLVRLDPMGCGQFRYYSSDQTEYLVTFTYEDNTGGGS